MSVKTLWFLTLVLLLSGCAWFTSGDQQYRVEIVWQTNGYTGSYLPEGLRCDNLTLKNGQTASWNDIRQLTKRPSAKMGVCSACGYRYDPSEHNDIAFKSLPANWACPVCGAGKAKFAVKRLQKGAELIVKSSREQNWRIDPAKKMKVTRTGKDTVTITVPVLYRPTVIVLCDNVDGSFDLEAVHRDVVALTRLGYPVWFYQTNGESSVSNFDTNEPWRQMNTQSPTHLVNRVFDSYNDFLHQFATPQYFAPEDEYYLHVLVSGRVYSADKTQLTRFAAKLDDTGKFKAVFYVPVNNYDITKASGVDLRFVDPSAGKIIDASALK